MSLVKSIIVYRLARFDQRRAGNDSFSPAQLLRSRVSEFAPLPDMLLYILICLCLSLTGIAGLQMTYMFYLDRIDRERKKRIHELEHQCKIISARLKEAQEQIEEQGELLKNFYEEYEDDGLWADVIDDR